MELSALRIVGLALGAALLVFAMWRRRTLRNGDVLLLLFSGIALLVVSGTDPLDAASVPGSVQDAATGPEGAAAETVSLDSDADRLADADEAAVGTDPTNPDTDGDGYYDGDEMNLGTGPFDPMSFPIV